MDLQCLFFLCACVCLGVCEGWGIMLTGQMLLYLVT